MKLSFVRGTSGIGVAGWPLLGGGGGLYGLGEEDLPESVEEKGREGRWRGETEAILRAQRRDRGVEILKGISLREWAQVILD